MKRAAEANGLKLGLWTQGGTGGWPWLGCIGLLYRMCASKGEDTLASALWTVQAERRFRALRQELLIQKLAYARLHNTVENVQGFLEKDETLRKISVIIPFPLNRRS